MTAEINGHNTPRPSGIKRNEMEKRIKSLEVMVQCLRKQVRELQEKK